MKNYIKIFSVIIVIASVFLFSSAALSEPIPDRVRKCVAYIVKPGSTESQNKPVGTGFFVGYKYPEVEGKTYVFLVTAKHVLFDDNGKLHQKLLVRLNEKESGNARDFDLLRMDAWFTHEKEQKAVDIAVHPLLPREAEFLYISKQHFITDEVILKRKIGIGDELFYTGLLSYHSGLHHITPIVRFGRIALTTTEKTVDGRYYHFIDAGNIPGHSGSPVFLWATATRKPGQIIVGSRIFGLYGVVSGVLEYNKELKATVPKITAKRMIPIDARSGGITAIVPVKYLIDILESAVIKRAIGITIKE